jgi:hypothetical protein
MSAKLASVIAMRAMARFVLFAVAAFVLGWMGWAVVSWLRYGHATRARVADARAVRFLPGCEVAEMFETTVAAPAQLTFSVAENTSLDASSMMRAIFRGRELLMRSRAEQPLVRAGVVDQMRAIGWGVLSDSSHREIVLGAVTQPWRSNVAFHALPLEEFRAFDQPGHVKIVVTIAADSIDDTTSTLRIETLARATDSGARKLFRRYWAVFSPGILLIRVVALGNVKREAERRFRRRSSVQ